MLSADDLAQGVIFPRVRDIRAVSATVAAAVIRAAAAEGHVRHEAAKKVLEADDEEALRSWVMSRMFNPTYVPLVPRPLN